ncbi:MAG: cellulose biosynthesis cyclic di-GMP-binding regulatory protein BcsB, partial [Nannocystaceae bacterium]|nr:cellulose biosynthesis cyclic di-GMP-binding regulatory protein BcsB [Nannocystaceae bacterium]
LWSTVASADTQPFAQRDEVLRGKDASYRRTIDVGEADKPARAEVDLRYSSRVDAQRSVATVLVDGTPRASLSLARATKDGAWSVSLGRLPDGPHTVELTTRLVPLEDDCEPDDHGTWAVVEDSSTLEFEPAVDRDVSLQRVAESWRARELESVWIASQGDATGVMQARVLADHLVRDWGFMPEHNDETRSGGEPTVFLHTVEEVPENWAALSDALLHVEAAPGVIGVSRDAVRVLARTPNDLPWVTEALADPEFRRLCGVAPLCLVGPPTQDDSATTLRPLLNPGQAPLVGAQGWEGRGEGTHTLEVQWSPPPGAVIERWPMVHLPIRWSGLGRRGGDATLSVRIAGRSVATYDLSKFETNETTNLAIRVPKAWWSLATWPIEMSVSMRLQDTEPCQAIDPSFPWVSVDPSARLEVPHVGGESTGIAGWYKRSLAVSAPVAVHWVPEGNVSLAAQVAAVLYPLTETAGGSGFAFIQGPESAASLVVRSIPGRGEPVQALVERSGTHLFAARGQFGMPMLDMASIAYLALDGGTLEFVPATGDVVVPVPPMGGLSGLRAVTVDDQWEAFDVPPPTAGESVMPLAGASLAAVMNPVDDSVSSNEERTRRLVDLVWLIGSGLILGGVVWLLRWRATR